MVYALPILGKWGSGVWRADELFPDTRLRYIDINILIICPFLTILPIQSSYFYSVDALVQHTGCSANTKSQMIEYQTGMTLMLIGIIIAFFVWIKTLKSIISCELTMILNRQIIKSKLVINANWPSRCWTELRLLADWKTNTQLSFIVISVKSIVISWSLLL